MTVKVFLYILRQRNVFGDNHFDFFVGAKMFILSFSTETPKGASCDDVS